MSAGLQMRRLWWALGLALLLTITALSLLPIRGPDLGLPQGDKWHHALAYLVLTTYFGQLLLPDLRSRFVLVLALLGYGIAIELAQSHAPGRAGRSRRQWARHCARLAAAGQPARSLAGRHRHAAQRRRTIHG